MGKRVVKMTSGRSWSDDESDRIRASVDQGWSDERIAESLARPVKAVTAQRILLGLPLGTMCQSPPQ